MDPDKDKGLQQANPYESLAEPSALQNRPRQPGPGAGSMRRPQPGPLPGAASTNGPAAAPANWGQAQATGAQTTPKTGQTTGPNMMQETGPTATGFVNFGDLYNANAGVATQRVNERQRGIVQHAKNAQGELSQQRNAFNEALAAGTAKGPSMADFDVAGGAGYMAGGTGGTAADEQGWALGKQKAGAGYTGPTGLSESDAYSKLAGDTAAAQDEVNNPLTGMNATDASLLGAAGNFGGLQQHYGDMKGQLDKANALSSDQAKAAKQESDNALKQYDLLSQTDAATKANAPTARPDTTIKLPAVGGGPDGNVLGGTPDTNGTGISSAAQWSQILRDMGFNPDGDTGRISSDEKDVIKQLGITPQDQAALASMSAEQRKAWIAQRKKDKGIA